MYVVCLVFLCHRRWLVCFYRSSLADTLFMVLRLGKGQLLFCIVQLVFDFFNTRHGSLYLSRIEFL